MIQLNDNIAKSGIAGRRRKTFIKIDMTPMVDLGFLLITFFIFTTQLSKPMELNLFMPKEGPPTLLPNSDALTVLLSRNNTIFYYHGDWEKARKNNGIHQTTFSVENGLGKVIREKQILLNQRDTNNGRNGLMLVIKPANEANYQNVIDALDEVLINNVKKYAIVDLSEVENNFLQIIPAIIK